MFDLRTKVDFTRTKQKKALESAFQFSRPKSKKDVAQGRNNAQDASTFPKGYVFK